MNYFKNISRIACLSLAAMILFTACQKLDKPELGNNYPKDSNPPGGPLKFYVAFDGTTSNPSMNAVDSIRASFASDNPLTFVDGIRGKAMKGEANKFIKYAKPNDWAITAESFTISFWFKRDGQTKNNIGQNGPEHILTFVSNNGSWSGGNTMVFIEGSNTAAALKVWMMDKNKVDSWMTWEGGNSIAGLLDNNWHHIALVYNAANSTLTLYKDGVANPVVRTWTNHGKINIDNSVITEVRVGGGPASLTTGDWLSSTYKGLLDQLRLYSTALTAAEVSALFVNKQ